MSSTLNKVEKNEFLIKLEERFIKNKNWHKDLVWAEVLKKINDNPTKLWSLYQMEITGGEPDILDYDLKNKSISYVDSSLESPSGRRSLCYDNDALVARKANKPLDSAQNFAQNIGISLLTEEQYRKYHRIVLFDKKTSSWIHTPNEIRELGGSLFCDFRFGKVFTYHNGAESYYANRGLRGILTF